MIIMHASSMIIINIIILTPKTARKNRGTELRCWVTFPFIKRRRTKTKRRHGSDGWARGVPRENARTDQCIRIRAYVRSSVRRWLGGCQFFVRFRREKRRRG